MKKLTLILMVMMFTFVANSQDAQKVYRTITYSLGENSVKYGLWCQDKNIILCYRDYLNNTSHTATALLEDSTITCYMICDTANNLASRVFMYAVLSISKINFDTDVGVTEKETLDSTIFWTRTVRKGNIVFRKKTSSNGILMFEIIVGGVQIFWIPKTEIGNLWSNRLKKNPKWEIDMKNFIVSNGEVNAFPNDIANLTEAEETLKRFLEKK